ncbi:MAG: carbohydrate ABC transporter permease [Lachnospiraceae bacterium]|nr:carbohydrate ABC transporter permease [Lachnospiraceae bacterium]
MSKKIKEKKVVEKEYRKKLIKKRKPNRSIAGDIALYVFLGLMAWLMVVPLVYQINNAMKPLDELFRYPPRMFALNPTFDNFFDLFVTMGKSWVSFTRYLFNTLFVTVIGTAGHLLIASMGAFVLAKYEFPGAQTFFKIVTVSMMFVYQVTQIPNYLILNGLNMIDSYWAIIIPAFASPTGFFLMKQFMEGLPSTLIEAAKIDGANEWRVFSKIVMPNVKPALMTMIIFSVQALWNNPASMYIYSEEKKTLVFAMNQIQGGGIARMGQGAAVAVVLMIVPILTFIISESQILETMASSGLKD